MVGADGLAMTNYHVVSQYALEPKTYRLEFRAPDGSRGSLKLLAIDVINDLAVVQLDKRDQPYFEFGARALQGTLPRGERLYAMGNPLDLGFTIVDGTYNGLVERSYNERIHFSGAINPGMSGGPAVTADSRLVGINVAKRLDGELVSFLVPARFAAALIDKVRHGGVLPIKDVRAEIRRQVFAWQDGLYAGVQKQGFRVATFGAYRAPESAAPWFNCWARTNADQIPKPRASANSTNCNTDTRLFLADDWGTGTISFSHTYAKSIDLNAFQFAAFMSQQYRPATRGGYSRKRYTRQRCHDDFVAGDEAAGRPAIRAIWCARAYRDLEGLYDVGMVAVTQDRSDEALLSKLSMQGVSYENAMALTKSFIGALQWAK